MSVLLGVMLGLLTATMIITSSALEVSSRGPNLAFADPVRSNSIGTTSDISINITSPMTYRAPAGEFFKLTGTILNRGSDQQSGIAYISLVDDSAKAPIDLEDWSASKGLYIPAIAGGQVLPLEWNIRLVKAGNYTIDIVFNKDAANGSASTSPPYVSDKVLLEVVPKTNLNPGNILPIAFGAPAVLIALIAGANYARAKKVGTR